MTQHSITLTPKAVEATQKQLAKRGGGFLRLGVRGGSCAGYSYVLEFADEKHSRDIEFDFDDVKVLVDLKSIVLLNGCTLDYKVGLMNRGYEFINPAATSKCGCGQSFGIDAEGT
jgi:iron-sulfur cluster assembly accessory protein